MDPIKPQHYVVRPGNKAVPLIALDELPQHIRIDGVNRFITDFRDTMHMTCVGELPPRHQTYIVTDINKRSIHIETPVADPFSPKKYYGIDEQAPNHDPLPPWKDTSELSGRLPTPGKKVYCSHWMTTGECDYAQQGCLYKHEMPLDIKALEALGYKDIPRWYREKYGIGKLTAVPGSGAHIRGPSIRQKPRNRRKQRNLLDVDEVRTGLLNSQWAPIAPEMSDGSFRAESDTSGSGESVKKDGKGQQKWARPRHRGQTRPVPQSRRTSVASEHELTLVRAQEARDAREAAAYELTCAKFRAEKEQAKMKKKQEEAVAAAKGKMNQPS